MACSISWYIWAHEPWKLIEFMLEVTYLTALPWNFYINSNFLIFVWIRMMIWWYSRVAGPFMICRISWYIYFFLYITLKTNRIFALGDILHSTATGFSTSIWMLIFVWIRMMLWWYGRVAGPFMTSSITSCIWAHKPWKPIKIML